MPELPDVEVYKQYVDATSLHKRIDDVVLGESLVKSSSPQTIREKLYGSSFRSTRRHGKHLFLELESGWLRLHFGMTGYLEAREVEIPDHTELLVQFEDGGHLAYVNQRKFGAIDWVSDVDAFIANHDLGPDPLADDMSLELFEERLRGRSGAIKTTMMSQDVIAGLGNVYVDEILFHAAIHPESSTEVVAGTALDTLFDTMMRIIEEAIEYRADVEEIPDHWLLGHRGAGRACPRDGTELKRIEVGGRPTYFCPAHQRRLS